MKLELKHIAPYLPYGLKGISKEEYVGIETVKGFCYYNNLKDISLNTTFDDIDLNMFKPILRPLSDLFKPIDWHNDGELTILGHKFGVEKITDEGEVLYTDEYYADYAESPKVNIDITAINWWLFEYHFDVFGLIEKGLAININTIKE